MKLKTKISAVKLPHLKGTAGKHSVVLDAPDEVLLPMNMHGGAPAVPIVEIGDKVRIGQMIAKEEGRNSVPVHATVSGTVKAIEDYESEPHRMTTAIRIESDGKMELDPNLKAPDPKTLEEFLDALKLSGIVGLGGAAFPLWAKLDAARKGHIKTVLVNGAECEPYITSDHRTMVEHSDLVFKGVNILKRFLQSEEFVIGIEDNKKDAIEELTKVFKDDPSVNVKPLKSVYPQGAKQVFLYNTAGVVVEEGQRLASLGYIIINITTLAKMALYMETGMPLVDRCVTLDGSAVNNPGNYVVPIGTSIRYLVEKSGGLKSPAGKVLFGGPMMGKTAYSMDQSIIKATNAIVVMDEKDAAALKSTACLHCGRCVAHCPLGLNPVAYAKALEIDDEAKQLEVLQKEQVMMCMECGCCSYICPAHRPLVENNRKAKGIVKKAKAAAEAAAKAAAEVKEGGK